jgi:hypothetical protein
MRKYRAYMRPDTDRTSVIFQSDDDYMVFFHFVDVEDLTTAKQLADDLNIAERVKQKDIDDDPYFR